MITQTDLHQLLKYNPTTGQFVWAVSRRSRYGQKGSPAGNLHSSGYIHIRVSGQLYKAHRVAWCYVHGYWPAEQIDHINRVRHDNRIANLRLATPVENSRNRGLINPHPGVTWDAVRNKWRVQRRVNGKVVSAGRYDTKEAAIAALTQIF